MNELKELMARAPTTIPTIQIPCDEFDPQVAKLKAMVDKIGAGNLALTAVVAAWVGGIGFIFLT